MAEKYDWRYENSIQLTKQYVDQEIPGEHKYNPWRTNGVMSNFIDTILYANAMNCNYHLDPKLQYDFLFHSVPKKKRFFKREKVNRKDNDVIFAAVQQYYKYSNKRTLEALTILTEDQIDSIVKKQEKGGVK